MRGRRLRPQKYALESDYVHSDLEPVINILYPTEREILGLTVQYGCCEGTSSIVKTSILMKNDCFQSWSIKSCTLSWKRGINALVSRIILFCCGKQTLYKKKTTVQPLITSIIVKS